MKESRFSFIIPVYNHEDKIRDVVLKTLKHNLPVIVVDDGSTDSSYDKIKDIKNITIIKHSINRGKGAAIITGFKAAVKISDWAITIDGDGQHNPDDTINMIDAVPTDERPIIIGRREGMYADDVPWTSSFGRKFSNFWVRASGGPRLTDSQSGLRIYPIPECLNLNIKTERFQFEVEIVVKANWNKIPFIEVPISVDYKPGGERISHFRPFIDFMRNSNTFTRLIFQRIVLPSFIRKKI